MKFRSQKIRAISVASKPKDIQVKKKIAFHSKKIGVEIATQTRNERVTRSQNAAKYSGEQIDQNKVNTVTTRNQ